MSFWRMLGVVCQAVVMGALLFLAVAKLVALSTGARIFQYEGF